MVHGSAVFLFELLVVVLIGTMIGAFILKTSCALYNLLAGTFAKSPSLSRPRASDSVPETRITSQPGTAPTLADDWAYRQKVETPLSVPKPSFEWAMCIVFVVALVNALVYFLALRIFRLAGMAAGLGALRSWPIDLILCPLSFFIHSGISAAMLPTSFGKGMLISLIYLFLGALVAVVLYFVLVLVVLIFGPEVLQFGW